MKKFIIPILVVIFTINPVLSQSKVNKKKLKKEKAEFEYTALKKLINTNNFVFTANWCFPQGGSRIDLTTNQNQLKLEGDSADIYLPYFGVVHSSAAAREGGGIKFNGIVKNYKIDFNNKKMRIFVFFTGKSKTDLFDFSLTIFGNGNANLSVNSNNRNSISYDGVITKVDN